MIREVCPNCGSEKYKKNGHIHNGKQNYRCKECGRQFVMDYEFKDVGDFKKNLINKALLERNSLRGISRIFSVSLTWLLGYIASLYAQTPDDLGFEIPARFKNSKVQLLFFEADEMWSFVRKKQRLYLGFKVFLLKLLDGKESCNNQKISQRRTMPRGNKRFTLERWCVLPAL